jgi:hypothetical protein
MPRCAIPLAGHSAGTFATTPVAAFYRSSI